MNRPALSLPSQILIGAILGILVGLFFGNSASILKPIGEIYTMLLQAVVYPYIIATLLSSLGQLAPTLALRLLKRSWLIYVSLILLTFSIVVTLGLIIPTNITSFENTYTSMGSSHILSLLIPANPFFSLASNYVPAVVVFSVLFGIMLQRVKQKSSLINILDTISETCLAFWKWLIKFAPYGVFALLANTAGTIHFKQLTDLGEYLVLFFIGILVLGFWLIPIIISSMIPIRYKTLISDLKAMLIITTATTLSVVALPYIHEITYKLLKSQPGKDKETDEVVNTALVISYPFAQLGNFFIYLFILFAALYFNHSLTNFQQTVLPALTYISSIGSPTTIINSISFIANWLHLPTSTTELYVSIFPIARYGQVLASVMGFAFLTILTTFAFKGLIKIRYKKIILHIAIAGILLTAFVISANLFFPNADLKTYKRIKTFSLRKNITLGVNAAVLTTPSQELFKHDYPHKDALYRIQKTGLLRVGYNADVRPFMYFNNRHKLVGYDAAYAYKLAKALKARLVFIPFTWKKLSSDMETNKFDIAMSAIYVTEKRIQTSKFTAPYFKSPLAFIVEKNQRSHFHTANQIRKIKNLKIGVFNDPVLIPLIKHNFPNAKLVIYPKFYGYIGKAFANKKINAAVWSELQAKVWTLNQKNYIVVTPNHITAPLLMAYMVQQNSPQFLAFLNYWLQLKQLDGFKKQTYNQWILAHPIKTDKRRWSILHNVL